MMGYSWEHLLRSGSNTKWSVNSGSSWIAPPSIRQEEGGREQRNPLCVPSPGETDASNLFLTIQERRLYEH